MDSGELEGFVKAHKDSLYPNAGYAQDHIHWQVMTKEDFTQRSATYDACLKEKRPSTLPSGKYYISVHDIFITNNLLLVYHNKNIFNIFYSLTIQEYRKCNIFVDFTLIKCHNFNTMHRTLYN